MPWVETALGALTGRGLRSSIPSRSITAGRQQESAILIFFQALLNELEYLRQERFHMMGRDSRFWRPEINPIAIPFDFHVLVIAMLPFKRGSRWDRHRHNGLDVVIKFVAAMAARKSNASTCGDHALFKISKFGAVYCAAKDVFYLVDFKSPQDVPRGKVLTKWLALAGIVLSKFVALCRS